MNSSDLMSNSFFTTNGKDIWKLQSFFTGPSCEMLNLENGKKETFGMNGLTARNFHKIKMPSVEDISK